MSSAVKAAPTPPAEDRGSRFAKLVAEYRRDHTHPVNHILHVFVGWPLVGASLFLLPFRPIWALALFVAGYAMMWTGHFVFERNIPTILKHPTTPFVMAVAVTRGLFGGLVRGLTGRRRG